MMNLKRLNTRLTAIVIALVMTSISAQAYIVHEVKRSETLWGIARHYNVDPNDLIKANPQAERGVKNGMRLLIPEKSDLKKLNDGTVPTAEQTSTKTPAKAVSIKNDKDQQPATTEIEVQQTAAEYTPAYSIAKETPKVAEVEEEDDEIYTARFGDTLHSISLKTEVSENDLLKYNILLDPNNIPEGYKLRLTADAPMVAPQPAVSIVDSIVYNVTPIITDETPEAPINVEASGNVIAIMLPFDADGESISRQSMLATDFYKGFLLAAKEATADGSMPLKIIAIDTYCSSDELDRRLESLRSENVSIIIPAEDEHQLDKIERFALENNALVLNTLNIKDEGYKRYPNVLQSNISQKLMYEKAISSLLTDYADFTPVILDLAGGKDEKATFVDELKHQYEQRDKKVINLSFKDMLEEADLAQLPANGKYIFLTKSGSADVFSRVSETLSKTVEMDIANETYKVFGYPDWITFRGDNQEALHRMGASIYSRFYMDDNDPLTEEVKNAFIRWYGNPMEDVYPSQGMLGYDTGRMLISKLKRANGGTLNDVFTHGTYSGMQSTFHFIKEDESSPDSGMVNDALYIIEFMPGGLYYVKSI